MAKLEVGERAPAFRLRNQHGEPVELSDFEGRRLVVYFYPKADTPGCTAQSCALRDAMPDLTKLGVDVVGISPDAPEALAQFDDKYSLGFTLLADEDHATAEAWGTWGQRSMDGNTFMGIIRSAFVVDERGTLAAAFYKVSPEDTVPKVQQALAD